MSSQNAVVDGNSSVRSLVFEASYDLTGKGTASVVKLRADTDLAIQFSENSLLGGAAL
jgi:hypothetical protein